MSLPRKNLRAVEVDGIAYEWLIRKKPTYSQAAFNSSMIVAIQKAEEERPCVLVADLQVKRPDNWISPHQTAVKPAMVRNLISKALESGWQPTSGGKFDFTYSIIRDRS